MSINFLAVLAAAFSSFVLGGLWYSRCCPDRSRPSRRRGKPGAWH